MIISEVKNDKKLTREYPYLGHSKCTDTVVLFMHQGRGVCLKASSGKIGVLSETWIEDNFEPLTGELVLRNG
jgi:hypothetical protein